MNFLGHGRLWLTLMLISITVASARKKKEYNPVCPNIYGSEIGEKCTADRDCISKGAVCLTSAGESVGVCECHPHYRLKDDQCFKLSNKVGEPCSDSVGCRYPLKCNKKKCDCKRGYRQLHNRCVLIAIRNFQRCRRHRACRLPFQACGKHGRCACIEGYTWIPGRGCIVSHFARNCPDGSHPLGRCSVSGASIDVFENAEFTGNIEDTCPQHNYCVTDGLSPEGHCCPAVCPWGHALKGTACTSEAGGFAQDFHFTGSQDIGLLNRTISAVAKNRDFPVPCPLSTHYCYRSIGASYALNLCCPRPCTAGPVTGSTSVYSGLSGRCLISSVHTDAYSYDDQQAGGDRLCSEDIQCDGGVSMFCLEGACACRPGYAEATDKRKLSETCVRRCRPGQGAIDSMCLGLVELTGGCYMDWQCSYKTPKSICATDGVCRCKCGTKYNAAKNECEVIKKENKKKKASNSDAVGNVPNQFTFSKSDGELKEDFMELGKVVQGFLGG